MYSNQILDAGEPLTPDELRNVETELGIEFPTDYVQHYLRYNGGRPMRNLFPAHGELFQVRDFLPIARGRVGTRLEDTLRDLRQVPGFPAYLVPFAIDPGGDYYGFNLNKSELGAVYLHSHEHMGDERRELTFLANSLPEFVDGMVEEPEESLR